MIKLTEPDTAMIKGMPKGVPIPMPPGARYGRLVVLDSTVKARTLCRCDCGRETTVIAANLRKGDTRSCGCLHSEGLAQRNYRHGVPASDYRHMLWSSIKQRCYNPKNKRYPRYGARGIGMWQPWRDDAKAFMGWLDQHLGPRPEGHSLDRIDNDGDYEPGNLRWATTAEQNANSSRWDGGAG